jgi:putative tryptophan/tyrosine transport system substrate-binding protein
MNRRAFLGTLGLFAGSRAAEAQQGRRVSRVGYLASGSSPASPLRPAEMMRQGLRELAWVEGQDIVIEARFADGRYDRLPGLAADLVRLNVDLIAAVGAAAARAAKNATHTIPIVMISVGDPVGLGLVANLAQPGGNVTGLAFSVGFDTYGKGLELLKEAVPGVRRVAVLSNPANPYQPLAIENVTVVARSLGVQLQLLAVRDPNEIDGAFAAMVRERAGALLVMTDPMFTGNRARLADLGVKHKLPSMHGVTESAEAGALLSYGPNFDVLSRRAAIYVDKILKGAKPGDLPIEQPTRFELVINLKTAKALGLTVPPSLLARADQVIE